MSRVLHSERQASVAIHDTNRLAHAGGGSEVRGVYTACRVSLHGGSDSNRTNANPRYKRRPFQQRCPVVRDECCHLVQTARKPLMTISIAARISLQLLSSPAAPPPLANPARNEPTNARKWKERSYLSGDTSLLNWHVQ